VKLGLGDWPFSPARWRRRARLSGFRRRWWRLTHEYCCNFDQSLFAFLAPRLDAYAEVFGGSPCGYPDPESATWTDSGPVTDHAAWERDVRRAAAAFRYAAETGEGWEGDHKGELQWALRWLAEWCGGVWI
jgi:hypothetical protein